MLVIINCCFYQLLLLLYEILGKKQRIYNHINITNIKMGNKIKDIDIKNRTYYFFSDMINIKIFDPNEIKIDKKSYKNILIIFNM